MLGALALIGFQFSSVFQAGFQTLPASTQYLELAGLGVLLLALGFLIAPSAYHRIVERGEDTEALHRFSSAVMLIALTPFVLSLAIDMYVATMRVIGKAAAGAVAAATVVVAGFFWYGLEALARRWRGHGGAAPGDRTMTEPPPAGGTSLEQKVEQVLTEARVVLPGAQALLGFQLAAMFTESFERLPLASRQTHLLSLGLVAIATIVLMTPAAYHRIVEGGEDTEQFHRFASRCLLAAMVPLAMGIAGDFYVVTARVTGSTSGGVVSAVAALAFFYGIWFGLMLFLRATRRAGAMTLCRVGAGRRRAAR